MKFSTHSLTAETFQGWSLEPTIDEMLAEFHADSGGTSRVLIKSKALTVVLVVLPKGHELAEHHAQAPIFVVPLRGEVVFERDDGQTPVRVKGCQVLAMGQGQTHAVRALVDSAFLLALGQLSHEQMI